MTKEKLTEEQREEIITIMQKLYREEITFDWSKTEEGIEYWAGVVEALERIANSNPEEPKEVEKEIELNGRKYRLVEE